MKCLHLDGIVNVCVYVSVLLNVFVVLSIACPSVPMSGSTLPGNTHTLF